RFTHLILYSSTLFLNHSAPTAIYTLSLHDALPISIPTTAASRGPRRCLPPELSAHRSIETSPAASSLIRTPPLPATRTRGMSTRSEEHTSELQVTWPSRMPSSA